MKKTIGIIGGMGPLATADLFGKILERTDASCDGDHLHILIDNNTAIPDRTAAILRGGPSPVPELVKSARILGAAGADFLIMPCNTAHYFYDALVGEISLPVLHMLRLTADAIAADGVKAVGLLATDGTIATGVYGRLFEEKGVEVVTPSPEGQKAIMSMIYDDIKAGRGKTDTGPILETLSDMSRRGAERFVLGCTELPIAFARYSFPVPFTDPTTVLADAAIAYAGGRVKLRKEEQHGDKGAYPADTSL